MVKRIGGARRKTRALLKKNFRKKGKISLTKYFAEYGEGDRVQLVAEPAVQKGLYCLRYYGKHGIVSGKKGKCYIVEIKDRTARKSLIVHPVHMKKL